MNPFLLSFAVGCALACVFFVKCIETGVQVMLAPVEDNHGQVR